MGGLDIQRSSNYVLTVVLYAIVLFFAGMSTRLSNRRLRWVTTIAVDEVRTWWAAKTEAQRAALTARIERVRAAPPLGASAP